MAEIKSIGVTPDKDVIEAIEILLGLAKEGKLRSLIYVGSLTSSQLMSHFVGTPPNRMAEYGELCWLVGEYDRLTIQRSWEYLDE